MSVALYLIYCLDFGCNWFDDTIVGPSEFTALDTGIALVFRNQFAIEIAFKNSNGDKFLDNSAFFDLVHMMAVTPPMHVVVRLGGGTCGHTQEKEC